MSIFRLARILICVHLSVVVGNDACSCAEASDSAGPTAQEVLAAYEASCAAITSFDVIAKVTSVSVLEQVRGKPPRTPFDKPTPTPWKKLAHPAIVAQKTSRQRYSGGKFRIDCMEIDGRAYAENSLVSAWNKDVFKRMSLSDRSGSVQRYARTQVGPHGVAYENLFLAFDGNYSLASFIRDRRLTCERDGDCFVLTAHPETGPKIRASGMGLRLYIDPARGFMPTRGAYLIKGYRWPQSEWKNKLYEPIPGIWVPKAGTFRVILWFDKDSPFAGTPVGTETLEIDVTRARFNTHIDDAVFNIDFPPGLTVKHFP